MKNPVYRSPGLKLGILGGGQLARMLALAAYPYGILPQIYATKKNEPAAQVSPYFFQGDPKDPVALQAFLENCDVVTFESEFLDAELLARLSEKTSTPIYPRPQLMGKLQDRLTQKQLLDRYRIPTAPYSEIERWADLQTMKSFGSRIVVKQRRFGYDGYGTFFVSPDIDKEDWSLIEQKTQEGFIGEKMIPFRRELALLMARDQFGQILDFPLVESKQTRARCDWVMGPLRHPQEASLRKALKRMLIKENYIGLIAFELFDTGKQLLVNEIAPRVHNSGHYSLDALSLNQFEAHVLAVSGYKLPSSTKVLAPFAMVNLLGESTEEPEWLAQIGDPKTFLKFHWYGKDENRPDRKMGHINAIASKAKDALKAALKARRKVRI